MSSRFCLGVVLRVSGIVSDGINFVGQQLEGVWGTGIVQHILQNLQTQAFI